MQKVHPAHYNHPSVLRSSEAPGAIHRSNNRVAPFEMQPILKPEFTMYPSVFILQNSSKSNRYSANVERIRSDAQFQTDFDGDIKTFDPILNDVHIFDSCL